MKRDGPCEKNLKINEEKKFLVQVKPEQVEKFIVLTGDRNSLHVDQKFSRRSGYRQNIVHGMFPVLFVVVLCPEFRKTSVPSLQKLSARFISPVYAGDTLCVNSKVINIDEKNSLVDLEFFLKRDGTNTALTTGSLQIKYSDSLIRETGNLQPGKGDGMIVDPLVERELLFDQIEKGDASGFNFILTEEHAGEVLSIISESLLPGVHDDAGQEGAHFLVREVLASSLFSTFVGMCQPGKYATFTDFSITFNDEIRFGVKYSLAGKVGFKSESTSTLVENLSICEEGKDAEPKATGKANVKVNMPPIAMLSINDLRADFNGLELEDKVVLITGASMGIGETSAKLFSLHGSKVVVNYNRGKEDADRIVAEIIANGGEAIAVKADVSDQKQVKEMFATTFNRFGKIDVLVNNAVRDAYPVSFLELSWEEVQRDIDVTIKGAFNCCQEALPMMMKNNGGKIINLSTIATDNPPPKFSKYVISKIGLVGLTRCLAVEFAPYNVQVNMVVPSFVETDLTKHFSKIAIDGMKTSTPMQRNATPVDVAQAVVLLASSLASFTTGQKIMVTGGNPPFL